uniref:Ribose 5-phosphate isomerase B n=1 Tax=uncultured bacterium contig00048 TaxID=1181533 RepID=A0A806K249_9BACT|nr:ribose 5-phosphate isomerase B [uncultured bacterium contig00048]
MIALASDHGGYDLKMAVIAHLQERELAFKDYGCYDKQSCDYPDFGKAAALAIENGECERGIVVCTTGIGISIAVNRFPAIRCALCTSAHMARMSREHNDANILALGGGITEDALALEIVDTFLNTPFSNEEKHIRRIKKMSANEQDG